MPKQLGETFADELVAAGLRGISFIPGGTDVDVVLPGDYTSAQNASYQAVLTAHDATKKANKLIPLVVVKDRLQDAGLLDNFMNLMFATPARRNIFLKWIMAQRPIPQQDPDFLAILTALGATAAQITAITADP